MHKIVNETARLYASLTLLYGGDFIHENYNAIKFNFTPFHLGLCYFFSGSFKWVVIWAIALAVHNNASTFKCISWSCWHSKIIFKALFAIKPSFQQPHNIYTLVKLSSYGTLKFDAKSYDRLEKKTQIIKIFKIKQQRLQLLINCLRLSKHTYAHAILSEKKIKRGSR